MKLEDDYIHYYDMEIQENSSLEEMLESLLFYVRSITRSDAGTIYLKEANTLKFHIYQNDSVSDESAKKTF